MSSLQTLIVALCMALLVPVGCKKGSGDKKDDNKKEEKKKDETRKDDKKPGPKAPTGGATCKSVCARLVKCAMNFGAAKCEAGCNRGKKKNPARHARVLVKLNASMTLPCPQFMMAFMGAMKASKLKAPPVPKVNVPMGGDKVAMCTKQCVTANDMARKNCKDDPCKKRLATSLTSCQNACAALKRK